jgi:two-component system response regulator DevR
VDEGLVGAVGIGAAADIGCGLDPAKFVDTLRQVAAGAWPLPDEVAARPDLIPRVLGLMRDAVLGERPPRPITDRELDILRLVAAGLRNRDIGLSLGITEQTVKNHLRVIFRKLGVRNRVRAMAYAAGQGWINRVITAGVLAEAVRVLPVP